MADTKLILMIVLDNKSAGRQKLLLTAITVLQMQRLDIPVIVRYGKND